MKKENIHDLVHIQTIVPRSVRSRFKELCKKDDTTPSQWMRNQIKDYISKDDDKIWKEIMKGSANDGSV